MKCFSKILTIFIIVLCFTSCNYSHNFTQKIIEPVVNGIPVSGKWKIVDIVNNTKISKNIQKRWIGKFAQFSKEYVSVGEYLFHIPSFKLRTLSAREYLVLNHKSIDDKIKIPSGDTDVITITGKDKYLCEVLKLNKNEMLMEIYNYNLLLTRVSDKLDANIYNNLNQTEAENMTDNNGNMKTGVMLGLRSLKTPSDPLHSEYNYRTIFIAANGKKLLPMQQTNNIFFPRKSGFWKLDIKRATEDGTIKDIIHSYNIFIGKNEKAKSMKMMFMFKAIPALSEKNVIDYVGNDYASIETTSFTNNNALVKYKIVPIDSLPNLKPVTMNDIMGREGVSNIDINARNSINVVKRMGYRIEDENLVPDNFGLFRKNGHWYFQGRINYENGDKASYQDYRINVIPPSNLIFFDELSISWNSIKDRVPEATDAFTSPNKDIALVLTGRDKLMIYQINNGMLGLKPIQTIKLKTGEKVIMAEWATGNYVENWVKSFSGLK